MNKLPPKSRALILNMLCEGQSMRSTARLADVSFNTVAKLLIDAGNVCADLHDELVQDVTAQTRPVRRSMELHLREAKERR